MYTEDPDIETCDFRLTSIQNSTIANSTTKTNTTNTTSANKNLTLPARENFTKIAW
jgi:hypothetical protein